MKPEEIRDALAVRPFMPLRVVMTDGRTFDLQRSEGILLSRSILEIGRNPSQKGVYEETDFCPVSHIARLERLESAPTKCN